MPQFKVTVLGPNGLYKDVFYQVGGRYHKICQEIAEIEAKEKEGRKPAEPFVKRRSSRR